MIDWQDKVGRSQLTCASCGEAIPPGTGFFSALVLTDQGFQRLDFLPDHWQPDSVSGLLSWWRHTRPEAEVDDRPKMVNHAVLLSIFHDLKDATERPQQCFAWLLGLLLTRAKQLKFIDLDIRGDDRFMVVEDRRNGQAHRIRDPQMSDAEELRGQEDLAQIFSMPVGPTDGDEPISDQATTDTGNQGADESATESPDTGTQDSDSEESDPKHPTPNQ